MHAAQVRGGLTESAGRIANVPDIYSAQESSDPLAFPHMHPCSPRTSHMHPSRTSMLRYSYITPQLHDEVPCLAFSLIPRMRLFVNHNSSTKVNVPAASLNSDIVLSCV
jgi:hypothetical protein